MQDKFQLLKDGWSEYKKINMPVNLHSDILSNIRVEFELDDTFFIQLFYRWRWRWRCRQNWQNRQYWQQTGTNSVRITRGE